MQASGARTDATPSALAGELLAFWHALLRGTAKRAWALLEELGLNMPGVKALHALDDLDREVSVKELAHELGMSLPNASRTADALHRSGYVVRREDDHDRRVKRVSITDAGRAVVARIDTARLQDLERWAATLDDAQRTALHDALVALPHRQERP